ncbi:hypothetical protein LWI29_016330 [Acer saccharum]|uniref:Uncharacterized protein n=1 Tax=Acer saccharum TaxID=4024 RepID=A0AA39VDN4_ACESA|nr:hypothetical protein LWI29_016330 [Acer saccharum]
MESLDNVSQTFPSTPSPTLPPSLIQSGLEESPQVTKHSNSNSNILSESSHIENTGYQLPPRTTRGVHRQKYDPDPNAKVKYPIANHVSLHRLSPSCASFARFSSSDHSPLMTCRVPTRASDFYRMDYSADQNPWRDSLSLRLLFSRFTLCPLFGEGF